MLTEALRQAGGIDVEAILPAASSKKRADIFFEQYSTIVEVKEITNDRLSDPEVLKALNELITVEGPSLGGPVIFGTRMVQVDKLPSVLARKFFQRVCKRVQKEVAQANSQIRDTKEALGVEEARGLLVIVVRPMKMNLRAIGWAVHDELAKNDHPHLTDLMMVECETETPAEHGDSFISFHNRYPVGLPMELKVKIGQAWANLTGQKLQEAQPDDFDRRYP